MNSYEPPRYRPKIPSRFTTWAVRRGLEAWDRECFPAIRTRPSNLRLKVAAQLYFRHFKPGLAKRPSMARGSWCWATPKFTGRGKSRLAARAYDAMMRPTGARSR